MQKIDIIARVMDDDARVVFAHPYTPTYHRACQAMNIRGLLDFGNNPIPVPGMDYSHWYADIEDMTDPNTYANYAMLVRDFFSADIKTKFDRLFLDRGVPVDKIPRAVHNPDNYMRAHTEEIDRMIEKYRHTTSPLEFLGSKHQAEGVVLALASLKAKDKLGFIFNHDPGLGKTRQIAVAVKEHGFKKILCISPKTARVTAWPEELGFVFKDPKLTFLTPKVWEGRPGWNLLQWDSLRRMPEEFFNNLDEYDLIVADEYHYASNEESQRSRALEAIRSKIRWLWGATGTLVRKRPKHIVNPLRLIGHPIVNSEEKILKFKERYCGKWIEESQSWDFNYANNLDELHDLLKDCLVRHEKADTNLPFKLRYPIRIPMTKKMWKEYHGAWDDYVTENPSILHHRDPMIMWSVRKGLLQRKAAEMKVAWAKDHIDNLLAQDFKVVVFTGLTDIYKKIESFYKNISVGVRGGSSDKKRAEAQKLFQTDDDITVYIGNIIAAGIAQTLNRAHHSVHIDIDRTPTNNTQAEDRTNRGDQAELCHYWYPILDTKEERSIFRDFIESNEVTRKIQSRRDQNGNLRPDAKWVGDMEWLKKVEDEPTQ